MAKTEKERIESHRAASRKYDDASTKRLFIKLNMNTDADILEYLDGIGNKQGYIKTMIREDMKKGRKN